MLDGLFRQPVVADNRASLQALIGAPAEFVGVVGSVAVEPQYVDADFRDLFYHHYAGKHREWQRDCQRLHLWDTSGVYLGAIVLSFDPYGNAWIPFKYDLSPRWLAEYREPWYLLSSKRHIHAIDEAHELRRFPSIAQDGEYTRCAHAALWNVLTFLADRYRIYKARLPTEIQELSAKWTVERSFPSQGLMTDEMSSVLLACGLYPRIYHASSTEQAAQAGANFDLLDILDIYLDSGFPILTGIEKRVESFFGRKPGRERWSEQPAGGEGHAVVIMGHNHVPQAQYAVGRPALAYRHRSAYLVVDDNGFPYSRMKLVPNGDDRARVAYGDDGQGQPRFNCLADIIVPLPRRIGIFAEDVLALLPFLCHAAQNNLRLAPGTDLADVAFRPFLMSAGGYRQLMLKLYGPTLQPTAGGGGYLTVVGLMPLPHFVWVIEVVSRSALQNEGGNSGERVYGHIVLDASAQDLGVDDSYERFLLLWNLGMTWVALDHKGQQYQSTWTPPADIQSKSRFPLMCHNLREVRSSAFRAMSEL